MNLSPETITMLAIVIAVVAVVIIIFAIAKRYRIPDANEALIVTGAKGKAADGSATLKVVIGGGSFIIPFVQ
ncbi:MAG: hypothetical protein FWD55_05595 [Propionibacteriaceae bacterium]|nr:hypothetical protein [Propionibacteriaceae bacterium]